MNKFLVVLCLLLVSPLASGIETEGSSISKELSLSNAYVSAHFKCNRKRLWADLNTLKVKDVYITQYKIAGGKKRITQYNTVVEFVCTNEYRKVPDA